MLEQSDADQLTEWPLSANDHKTWGSVRVMIHDGIPFMVDRPYECLSCGGRLRIDLEPDSWEAGITNPCTLPEGITTTITLAVPSGKLVVDDDLRPIYDGHSDDFLDYNSAAGQAQVVEAMAAVGCAYGPVGNTSPTLYRTGDGTYVIANPAWVELDGSDDEYPDSEEVVPDGWTALAGVCTDLWAYSIADHDDFLAKGGTLDHPMRSVVEIPAGTYRFTHHTGERSFSENDAEPTIYAHIELVEAL